MRIEYVIISIIIMLVILVVVIAFLSGAAPSIRQGFDNFLCGTGLDPSKCKVTP